MNFLSDEERIKLQKQHKRERDKRVCDRIKAILLYDKGWTLHQIAEALLLSHEGIRNHIEDYKSSKKLKPLCGGSEEKLTDTQSRSLEEHLKEHIYLYAKDIIPYVKARFGIEYTVHGMRNWLQRHGFSYKKPAIVPGKANEQQQKEWIAEYEKLRSELPSNETICFIDGVHPTHNVQPAYGSIKRGFRKEIPANSGRSRLNLSGAVDVICYKIVFQEDKTLNADSTISFFQKIQEAYPDKEKIHVFCDNARYYKNKQVIEYLEHSKIKLHFLPPYSPNLNPIERLWKWMKERTIYNMYYSGFEEFKSAIFGFLSHVSSAASESVLAQNFRSRIRDKFRPIKSPIFNF
jgi:transposase